MINMMEVIVESVFELAKRCVEPPTSALAQYSCAPWYICRRISVSKGLSYK
jgi:hypothetical protein